MLAIVLYSWSTEIAFADARPCIALCKDQIVTVDDSAGRLDDSAGLMRHDEREFRLED